VLCLLSPAPFFHVFFRCLEVLHHLLVVEGLLPIAAPWSGDGPFASRAPLPLTLPMDSGAASFLTALHTALADPPPPASILRLALPRRDDYALCPLPTIMTDVPSAGLPSLPASLSFGSDFAEVQIPPSSGPAGVPHEVASQLRPVGHLLPGWAHSLAQAHMSSALSRLNSSPSTICHSSHVHVQPQCAMERHHHARQ
jgi:hypothetical protein